MTQDQPTSEQNDDHDGEALNWPRIAGISFAVAIHAAALLLLLAPVAPPGQDKQDDDVTRVVIIEPPPPPPPPPPPKDPPKPQEIKQLAPPQQSPIPPPPEDPPVVFDDPSPVDVQAPPPAPPAPPAPIRSIEASVDISSKNMNPPLYPPEERRRGVQGEVMLIITVDANGVATDVQVEHSSGNRNLDREAVKAAKRWRFAPAIRNGQKTGGRVRVPVNFVLN